MNDQSLSLILSLRINDQFLLQNQATNADRITPRELATNDQSFSSVHFEETVVAEPADSLSTSQFNYKLPQNIPSWITKLLTSLSIDTQLPDQSSIGKSNLTTDELKSLREFSHAINKIIENRVNRSIPETIEDEDSMPISAKQLERSERKKQRYNLQREIITIAKKSIKPIYQRRWITKEQYKIILKKVVTKATYSNRVDEKWITRMIDHYANKYRSM